MADLPALLGGSVPSRCLKAGSQLDTGAASVISVVSIKRKSFFFHQTQSNCIPDVKFFDNLIG